MHSARDGTPQPALPVPALARTASTIAGVASQKGLDLTPYRSPDPYGSDGLLDTATAGAGHPGDADAHIGVKESGDPCRQLVGHRLGDGAEGLDILDVGHPSCSTFTRFE